MTDNSSPLAVRIYVGVLSLMLLGTLTYATIRGGFDRSVGVWIVLTIFLGVAEYTDLLFHHERGRLSMSPTEAILLPMIVILSFSQVVWSVAVAVATVATFRWRVAGLKWFFNVSEYALVAGLSAAFAGMLGDGTESFTIQNAAAATAAVILFGILSNVLVSGVIALAEKRSFFQTVKGTASTVGTSLIGSIALGLVFAASISAAEWMVVILVLPLAAMYFSFRAVFRQRRERERVESLHAASRALAASPSLDEALIGFLRAMCEIASAREARAVINTSKGVVWSGSRAGETVASMEPLQEGPLSDLLRQLEEAPEPLIINEGGEKGNEHLEDLGATSLVAIPLLDDREVVGFVLAMDRVGVEEFREDDAKLLEAVGNELVLTLDSYRLFAEVAEERERFQQIFAGSKEGICLLDEEGVIQAWNPALARITGFDEEDIIGEKWFERILVRDRHHQRVEGLDIVKVPPDEELELVTRKGPPRWVAIMSGEIQSEDEKSWVILVRDITAEHELEESKSDFLSTISHELRTPLTTIKGSLQVMSRPSAAPTSDIGKQMIEIMKRGSDRLERLVMNLLAVSQMEAGDVKVYPDEVPLEEMVRARIASILIDHPQVEVIARENVIVHADRERLAQAVEHILDNARKFGPESGLITVEIAKENGYARLSITDEGPGIPKIDHERIFDRFVRLGHVLTRETQGPGVGLFIAKRSVEAMGGSVEVDSEPGRGSTFHVRIPLALAAVEPASSA